MAQEKITSTQVIRNLNDNLEEILEANRILVKTLQEELMLNAQFRGRCETEVNNLQKSVDYLQAIIIDGTPKKDSILIQLNNVENRITILQDTMMDSGQDKEKSKDRFWNFIVQNFTALIGWIFFAMWLLADYISKHNVPK